VPLGIPDTVDASGAIELELIYRQPLHGPLTLTFESITLYSGGTRGETIHGPWVFTIPNS
jgi:hypothetical protein